MMKNPEILRWKIGQVVQYGVFINRLMNRAMEDWMKVKVIEVLQHLQCDHH